MPPDHLESPDPNSALENENTSDSQATTSTDVSLPGPSRAHLKPSTSRQTIKRSLGN